jgi:protein SFI1
LCYSDSDSPSAIEALYDIVYRAQSSAAPSTSSSSALFQAYEQVLGEHGLRPADDAVLHRFLFRMQRDRRAGEELLMRFQRVLAEMGIEVELDEDEGIEVTKPLVALPAGNAVRRRASLDSFFDGSADKIAGTTSGDRPRRNRRSTSDTEAHPYRQPRRRNASVSSFGSLRIRRNVLEDAPDSDYTDHTTSLDLSRVQVPGVNAPIPNGDHGAAYDVRDAHNGHNDYNAREARESEHNAHDSTHYYQQFVPEPFQPSDTRLMDEAETFEHQRLHRITRECLHVWRNRVRDNVAARYEHEAVAAAFDRKILLRASLEQLRDTARLRRSSRETNRFFSRLEARADRARNIFLLTKAFTHWAKSTEDEVQRTSVARRHILRTRFFNGWREITAVNELKTQHFVLAKFLRLWCARAAAIRDQNEYAIALYEDNLVQRIYKEWFFKFCAVAAPAWRNDRLRKAALQKWVEVADMMREQNAQAVGRCNIATVTKMLGAWRQKIGLVRSLEPQADAFRQRSLLSSGLHTLQKQSQLGPLLRQFESRKKDRLLRSSFKFWQHSAHLTRLARKVDQLRISRNAWTAWNDRLRIQALEQRIDDRVVMECLYKWTLASRVSLFQRVHSRQLKHTKLLEWVAKTNQRESTLDTAERRFAQFKRAQLLRSCLRKMEAIATERKAEQCAIIAQYNLKLKQRIFESLKAKQEHLLQLKQWASDADFYVLTKRTLKTWNSATQHARRNRRRDAYAKVRRTVKLNLVRRMFETWRDRAATIAIQNQQANEMFESRVVDSSVALFHHWQTRAMTLRELDAQAEDIHTSNLAVRCLSTWTQRLDSLQNMEARAAALQQENSELAAASALKRLGWRLWNVRRQEETADALFERNFHKHVRAILRFWLEQTNERARPVSPSPRARGRRFGDGEEAGEGDGESDNSGSGDEAGEETQRLESWTAFDANALGLDANLGFSPFPTSPARNRTQPQSAADMDVEDDFADPSAFWSGTPLPPTTRSKTSAGYLKTPSKRSVVRAKRPELPSSPEKRLVAMSAPPVQRRVLELGGSGGGGAGGSSGVSSFEKRLREGGGGFGTPSAGADVGAARGAGGGVGLGSALRSARRGAGVDRLRRGKVGFGDVSMIG